jgi:hypothetical protein
MVGQVGTPSNSILKIGPGLPDTASGKFRVFAVDFPKGKGVLKEELLVSA